MSTDKPVSGSEPPEQSDSLSATGMFLRAFNTEPETPQDLTDETSKGSKAARPQEVSPPAAGYGSAGAPGEFTQFFQSPGARGPAAGAPPLSATSSAAPAPILDQPARSAPNQASSRNQGEFTRIFVSGVTPTAAVPERGSGEAQRPTESPASNPPRGKGFSSPGISDSAAGEGSFTQFFKSSTAAPPQSAANLPQGYQQAADPDTHWNANPILRAPAPSVRQDSSPPSVTSLLSSLSKESGRPGVDPTAPTPYRHEDVGPSTLPPSQELEGGGVTRLIQRLAQTPAEPVSPPAFPSAPPVSSGPGEFTRMISKIGSPAPSTGLAAPEAQVQMQPATPMPSAQASPATLAPAVPPLPAAPRISPAPVVPVGAPPKLPSVPAAALAPPKTKLESLVPILLVVNTFLLLLLLLIVVFLIKSK